MPDEITALVLERSTLSPGVCVMWKQYGSRLRAAYDPAQTTEGEAVGHLHLYAGLPRVVTPE